MTEPKVVCITGAARRIGATIARTFHRQGFSVIIHYHRSVDAAEQLATELNRNRAASAQTLRADLCNSRQVQAMSAQALKIFGRLDVLINNASSFYPTELGEISDTIWDELIDSNLRGAFFLSQDLSAELKRTQGAIVNIIDTHADQPLRGYSIYCIAKAGLKAMTRSLALELAPRVRVNAVSPGAILWSATLEDDGDPAVAAAREKILQQIPLGCLGKPQHVAATAYFLACHGHYLTGQVIKVDGGSSLTGNVGHL